MCYYYEKPSTAQPSPAVVGTENDIGYFRGKEPSGNGTGNGKYKSAPLDWPFVQCKEKGNAPAC